MNKSLKKKLATATATLAIMATFVSSAAAAPAPSFPAKMSYLPNKTTLINNEQTVILDNVSAQVITITQQSFNILIDISPTVAPIIAPNININIPEINGKK